MDESKLQADDVESGLRPPPSHGSRLSSVIQGAKARFTASSPPPATMVAQESDENLTGEEIVAGLVTHASVPPPPKAARENTVAPYGPDAPLDLQNILRGHGASLFNINLVPSVGQSMSKVGKSFAHRIHVPYLPFLNTLRTYTGEAFFHDMIAALSCAVLVTPESLSYMVLATLNPIIGLYSAALGPFMFAFFGTAKHLSVGPISLGCIYIPIALKTLGFDITDASEGARAARAEAAVALTFYVFAIFLFMSILRLGSVIRFVSHSVMAGFVTATGIFVSINQLKHILGLKMPKSYEYNYENFAWLFTHLDEAKGQSAALGLASLAVLLGVKVIKRYFPATPERMQSKLFKLWYYVSSFTLLIVVVAAASIAYTLNKQGVEMAVLGNLAPGLAAPSAPALGKFAFGKMIGPALQVALLAYVEASSISQKYADAFGYKVDVNQDLFGLAACNLLSLSFGGVLVSGAFGRSALTAEVGGHTPLVNFYLGIIVIILIYNTHILYWIPYSCLGAVIVSAMLNLVNITEFVHALRIARTSGYIMLFTFACTLFLSLDDGLVYGVAASLAMLLYQLSNVDAVVLGQEKGPNGELHLVSLRDNPRAIPCDAKGGVIVLHPVASLFFGNAECLRDDIERIIAAASEARDKAAAASNGEDQSGAQPRHTRWPFQPRKGPAKLIVGADTVGPDTRFILVDASGIRLLDLAALSCVVDVVDDAQREGISVVFAGCSTKLKASLKACGLYRRVGGPLTMHSAEEVYSLLVDAPAHMSKLAQQPTIMQPPPRYYSKETIVR